MADAPASNGFPIIDLLHFPAQLPELIKACEENGCFRIVNFDSILPVSLLYQMKAVVTELFELPLDIKQRNVDVIVGSGYKKPGEINAIHEGFGINDIASSRSVDDTRAILTYDVTISINAKNLIHVSHLGPALILWFLYLFVSRRLSW
ncbi:2-oxoglutarate (2OG) and Fe(II)-dependent oxygenase superfamily protein [Abeliophyllum distichum]|uniref:2-oxoglutarate (2OG) and Fe(II)-dependent oxygenase superfamily protein n=1 Tax=Abeliophyllum distichum TaxID=126358 RepID=A0ABD1V1K3_9LAMI